MRKILMISLVVILPFAAVAKKKIHPFDKFDHEMHMGLFEMAGTPCTTCHPTDDSYGNREKMNRLGCHSCHKNPDPPLPASQDCTVCHIDGWFPKPESHKSGWIGKHQMYAKQDANVCTQCHQDPMFCMDCHNRRDSVQTRMHDRNFKFFHSIQARANPRQCDACHVVNFCQQCHEGRGNSKK